MQHAQVNFDGGFAVLSGNGGSQAAVMVLAPGESTGGPDNRHRGSDQWLFVAAGEGSATVSDQQHLLRPGTLLLIERGETHEIRNEGDQPLHTLNFYVPPAYTDQGERLPAGEG